MEEYEEYSIVELYPLKAQNLMALKGKTTYAAKKSPGHIIDNMQFMSITQWFSACSLKTFRQHQLVQRC